MLEALFVISLLLPPLVVVLSAAALAMGSSARRAESPGLLRAHHA